MTAADRRPPRGGTADCDLDAGLLSPVRVGTPVEAAVGDTAWLQAMLDAEAALVRAQVTCGTVPAEAAAAITAAARAEHLDVRELALAARETANPVVGLVKALTAVVAAKSPAAAEYVHRGSTSQDIFDTGAMLVAARALRLIGADLRAVAAALAGLAADHRDTVMAGRTLALHAVPTTFGLKAAGWRQLVLEAAERLERVADGGLPVSLGGAAGTLAGYVQYAGEDADPADVLDLVAAFADETGLAVPVLPWHALRTPIADLAAALAHTAGALGKIAADVTVLVRTEIGEVAEPTAAGRGASSAMPHKRNPVLATLIRIRRPPGPGAGRGVGAVPVRRGRALGGGVAHRVAAAARVPAADRRRRARRRRAGRGSRRRMPSGCAPTSGRPAGRSSPSGSRPCWRPGWARPPPRSCWGTPRSRRPGRPGRWPTYWPNSRSSAGCSPGRS